MKFEIQYKQRGQIINNINCDIEYVMKIFELQYKGLAVVISLKYNLKQLDIESISNNLVF